MNYRVYDNYGYNPSNLNSGYKEDFGSVDNNFLEDRINEAFMNIRERDEEEVRGYLSARDRHELSFFDILMNPARFRIAMIDQFKRLDIKYDYFYDEFGDVAFEEETWERFQKYVHIGAYIRWCSQFAAENNKQNFVLNGGVAKPSWYFMYNE